jgi:hypothetical protein
MLATLGLENVFGLALWLTGIANFCVLGAGAQVPVRFGWRSELARLSPMNRKLMWVYYGFIGTTIVAFGILTLVFHDEMLRGERVALGLAAFMGFWWAARVAIDGMVFRHEDWPKGRFFVAGHVLLTTTFVAMTAVYLGLVAWRLWD